jgi:hypothetical protein
MRTNAGAIQGISNIVGMVSTGAGPPSYGR